MHQAAASPEGASKTPTLLASGFRPFFLLAGLYAALSVPVWLLVVHGGLDRRGAADPVVWHGHEMLFGFVGAAVAGFLLTAVPNWTGRNRVQGLPLGGLVALWCAGRVVWWVSEALDPVLVAAIDLAFFPALLIAVAPPVIAARKFRNAVVLIVIALFFAANLLVHLERLQVTGDTAIAGLHLAVYLIALLITMIGGRIVPAFTASGLQNAGRPAGIRPSGLLDPLAIAGTAAVLGVGLSAPDGVLMGMVAAFAAVVHAARLSLWRGIRTVHQPILFILHVGYAWLPVGFALLAASRLTDAVPATAALHALTAGAGGTMILAVMTRAALGHAGRALIAPRPVVFAYALVVAGALGRVVAPLVPEAIGTEAMVASGACWAAAFALFVATYWPILTRPRIDGQPG